MNILHLHTKLNITCGITKSILLMILNSEQEVTHEVITLGGDNIESFEKESIQVIIPGGTRFPVLNHLRLGLFIYKVCKRDKIDIIHAHHRYLTLIAWLPSKLLNLPLVVSVQSKVHGHKKTSYKADAIIAVSNSIKNHLVNYFNINPKKVYIINNFTTEFNTGNEDISTIKEKLKIDKTINIILFAGRLSKEKGIDILLESFKIVQSKMQNCLLLITGTGEEKDNVVRYIADNSLNVVLFEPSRDLYDFYKIAGLIVLPSRVDPFPLVMLEAGIMKKAFIGSDVDGISECIGNNEDGILIEAGNSNKLAEAILYLLENKTKAEEMGRKLYIKVHNNYLAGKIVPEFSKLYKKLIYD